MTRSFAFVFIAADDLSWETSSLGLLLFTFSVIAVMIVITISWMNRWWQMAAMASCIWFFVGLLLQPWTLFSGLLPDNSGSAYSGGYWKVASIVWCLTFCLCLLALGSSFYRDKIRHRHRHVHHSKPVAKRNSHMDAD